LKIKIQNLEEDFGKASESNSVLLERVTSAEAYHKNETQVTQEALKQFQKLKAGNEVLKKKLIDAKVNNNVIDLKRENIELKERFLTLEDRMKVFQVKNLVYNFYFQ
jgi:hypothetical protein